MRVSKMTRRVQCHINKSKTLMDVVSGELPELLCFLERGLGPVEKVSAIGTEANHSHEDKIIQSVRVYSLNG